MAESKALMGALADAMTSGAEPLVSLLQRSVRTVFPLFRATVLSHRRVPMPFWLQMSPAMQQNSCRAKHV